MKVAQYEVLGNGAKEHVRPVRDDRNAWLLITHAAQRLRALVDRPVRDGCSLKTVTSTSYWATFTESLRDYFSLTPNSDPDRDLLCRCGGGRRRSGATPRLCCFLLRRDPNVRSAAMKNFCVARFTVWPRVNRVPCPIHSLSAICHLSFAICHALRQSCASSAYRPNRIGFTATLPPSCNKLAQSVGPDTG